MSLSGTTALHEASARLPRGNESSGTCEGPLPNSTRLPADLEFYPLYSFKTTLATVTNKPPDASGLPQSKCVIPGPHRVLLWSRGGSFPYRHSGTQADRLCHLHKWLPRARPASTYNQQTREERMRSSASQSSSQREDTPSVRGYIVYNELTSYAFRRALSVILGKLR